MVLCMSYLILFQTIIDFRNFWVKIINVKQLNHDFQNYQQKVMKIVKKKMFEREHCFSWKFN